MLKEIATLVIALLLARIIEGWFLMIRNRLKGMPSLFLWRHKVLSVLVSYRKTYNHGGNARYKVLLNLRSKALQMAMDEDFRRYMEDGNYQRKY